MKKYVLIWSLIAFISLTGCSDNSENLEPETTQQDSINLQQADMETQDVIELSDIDFYNPESVVNGFMNLIWQGNIEDAYKCVNLTDNTFISVEDLDYVLRRTKLSPLIGSTLLEPPSLTATIKGDVAYATYYPDSSNINEYERLNCVLSEDGTWHITPVYWVAVEYYCYVPSGVRLYINNIEVTSNYKEGESNGLDLYKIPNLPCKEVPTKIISSTFGDITGTITPFQYKDNQDNRAYSTYNEIPKIISNSLFNEIANAVGGMYNQVFSAMENNASSIILNSVMGGGKNYKFLETYYYDGIATRTAYGRSITDVEVLEITPSNTTISYIYDSKTVVINMNLKIHWKEDNVPCEENIAGAAKVVYENGSWKLDDITSSTWTTLTDGLNTTNENIDSWKQNNVLDF